MSDRRIAMSNFCEERLLPLACALAVGVLITLETTDHQIDRIAAALRAAEDELHYVHLVCGTRPAAPQDGVEIAGVGQ